MPQHLSERIDEAITKDRYDLLTATEIVTATRNQEIRAEKVAEQVRNLIEKHNPHLQAFVKTDLGAMMDRARKIDKRIQGGDNNLGIAAGLPIGIKDTYLDEQFGAKAGTKKQYRGTNASIVKRAKAKDANIIGKTATPELALDTCTPGTKNPWSPVEQEYSPRGSSGGAGVAATMRMGHIHFGSDGGGSGRTPAIANGVMGLKLKYDAETPNDIAGHIPPLPGFLPTLDGGVPAIIARSIADIELGLRIIKENNIGKSKLEYKKSLRFGILKDLGKYSPDAETAQTIDHIVESLLSAGHRVEEVPALNQLDPEALMRLIGLTFGTQIAMCINAGPKGIREKGNLLKWLWKSTLAKVAIGEMVKDYDKAIAKYADGNGGITIEGMKDGLKNPALINEVTEQRNQLQERFNQAYTTYDGIITPVDFVGQFTTRPMLTPMYDGSGYFDRTSTPACIANLTGNAAIAIASECSSQGLPVGFQIMTPSNEDALIIGNTLETLIKKLPPPPKFFE